MKEAVCSIDGCTRSSHNRAGGARGWCRAHYARWQNHGDPLGGRKTMTGEPEKFLREVVLAYEGDECLIWPYARIAKGYPVIGWRYAHRVICEEVRGPPPTPEHEAAHSCGKGHEACVTKRHLSWKTPLENIADKFVHGTMVRGERASQGKLTEAQALEIISLKGTMKLKDIGAKYGVSLAAISAIHCGISWAHLSKAVLHGPKAGEAQT